MRLFEKLRGYINADALSILSVISSLAILLVKLGSYLASYFAVESQRMAIAGTFSRVPPIVF